MSQALSIINRSALLLLDPAVILCIRWRDAHCTVYYQRKRDEVPRHQHERTFVLTARKLPRLLTPDRPYRPRRT